MGGSLVFFFYLRVCLFSEWLFAFTVYTLGFIVGVMVVKETYVVRGVVVVYI